MANPTVLPIKIMMIRSIKKLQANHPPNPLLRIRRGDVGHLPHGSLAPWPTGIGERSLRSLPLGFPPQTCVIKGPKSLNYLQGLLYVSLRGVGPQTPLLPLRSLYNIQLGGAVKNYYGAPKPHSVILTEGERVRSYPFQGYSAYAPRRATTQSALSLKTQGTLPHGSLAPCPEGPSDRDHDASHQGSFGQAAQLPIINIMVTPQQFRFNN